MTINSYSRHQELTTAKDTCQTSSIFLRFYLSLLKAFGAGDNPL